MSAALTDFVDNPYASPTAIACEPPRAPAATAQPGSLGLIFGGFVLLLIGYFTSNLLMISDLYHIGFGPNGQVIPSPLAALCSSPLQQWLLYGATAAAFVAGAVMLGSQRFNSMAVVCYVMCPLVGVIYLIASPLRVVQKYAEPVAAVYLIIGSCLLCTGATRLFQLYGRPTDGFSPIIASLLTEVGLAFVVGSVVKFCHIPTKKAEPESLTIGTELDAAPNYRPSI